jgi:hypothetical protein
MDVERAIEFILEQQAAAQAQSDARMSRIEENLARSIEVGRLTREELRRAVRLSAQEARAERKRRKEADEKLAAGFAAANERLTAGQESLQKSLQAFIDSIKQPRNGHDQN